ncbi:hypothetical protein [Zooshikella ganghwensis]|uniref:phage terminase large subunit family protein n=1 Tax=Zooshikella ganghwensis TaxID=202772 RepID=UPI0030B8E78B
MTGIGRGVYDLVRGFFPRAQAINYSVETKNQLVLKGLDVIRKGRLAFDVEMKDIPQAFMTIKQTTTPSGQITYSANRTQETGHADVAFAILHALFNEPINTEFQKAQPGHFRNNYGPNHEITVFSFGDPESVLQDQLQDYLGVFAHHNGDYYEPPVSLAGLAKLLRANPHHSACAGFKRNMLVKHYVSCDLLSRQELNRACYDFNVFGNCYFKRILNPFKQTLRLEHVPAINIRKGTNATTILVESRPKNYPL